MNEMLDNTYAVPATGSAAAVRGDGGLRVWPLRKPAALVLARGGALLLGVWSAAGLLYMWLLDDGPVGDADRELNLWLEEHRTARLDTLSTIGSAFSDTIVKVVLVAVVGGTMVALWKRWHDGVFLATVVIFEASVFVLTSFIVGRERPPVEQLETAAPSGSFPSGHAAAAVAFYVGLLIVVSWHSRHRAVRAVLIALAVLVPLAVASARLYRGMHHPVDVLAGLALGVASLIVVRRAMFAGVADIRSDAQRDDRDVPDRVTRLDLVAGGPTAGIVERSAS
jgi:membrane-associated phospholipid phosphatase